MKKIKAISILLSTVLCVGLAVGTLAGCSKENNVELPAYRGEKTDAEGNIIFNENLFYCNTNKGIGPDPFILDDPNSDYYYAYSTLEYMLTYRSKDLAHWETVGNVLDVFDSATEYKDVLYADRWAPEVIYDAEANGGDGKYFMFLSGTPKNEGCDEAMFLATSDSPEGPFTPVNFLDDTNCDGNMHEYDEEFYGQSGQYFTKYLFFEPKDFAEKCEELGYDTYNGKTANCRGFIKTIDPHPYIDANGTKYLYFCGNASRPNSIFTVEMENWYKPKLDTLKRVLAYGFYTVEDYDNASDDDKTSSISQISYETEGVAEGPTVYYNKQNQLYYLTYSTGAFQNNSYQVCQAVSASAAGPFRKLTPDENGCFLSGGLQGSTDVSGSGHHGLITVGDKLYAVYHRHKDFIAGGNDRYGAVDEIKWITVKDPSGADLLAMYSNGPTNSVQPLIKGGKYSNIAESASVTCSSKSVSNLGSINDGLLSSYYVQNQAIKDNVKEAVITETATFEFTFSTERTIRAVMVYDSAFVESTFKNVTRIEILSGDTNYVIPNVAINKALYDVREFDGAIMYMTPNAAAFAEFDEIKTSHVRVTVEVPAGQSTVGISEIRILGI